MTKSSRSPSIKRSVKPDWPATVFSLGVIVLVWGLFNYFFPSNHTNQSRIETSNTQRNLAIEEALKSGEKTYQFETNFIPGIGTISNPEAYKEKLEKEFSGNTK